MLIPGYLYFSQRNRQVIVGTFRIPGEFICGLTSPYQFKETDMITQRGFHALLVVNIIQCNGGERWQYRHVGVAAAVAGPCSHLVYEVCGMAWIAVVYRCFGCP